jgi:hypothetical protein
MTSGDSHTKCLGMADPQNSVTKYTNYIVEPEYIHINDFAVK